MSRLSILLVTLFLNSELIAQNDNGEPGEPVSRMEDIQEQRMQKAAALQPPPKKSAFQKGFSRIEKVLQESPLVVGVGGLGPGAGFAVGFLPEWRSDNERLRFKLGGIISTQLFHRAGAGVELPHLARNDLTVGFEGVHRYLPQLEYYGSGPDSSLNNQTDFLREDTLFESTVNFNLKRNVASTCRFGKLFLNIGPGTNGSLPSTETVFTPVEAPGIDEQSNYVLGGCSVESDGRDFFGDPHKGTYLGAGYDRYQAVDIGRFSFNRVSGVAEHYIPFLNHRRVIAMRAKTELAWHASDQVVPFYMQSTLGGDQTLRGFPRFRFYGENSILFNLEYRWAISMGWDMAIFGDAGKVFNRPRDISLKGLEPSVGSGFRLKSDQGLAARFDIGFSREGGHVWLRFGRLFSQ